MGWSSGWSVALAAFAAALIISAIAHGRTVISNRKAEGERNARYEPPGARETRWKIAHIRDDMGGIAVLLMINNALLAAILALLIAG